MKAFIGCWLLLLVACGGEVEETNEHECAVCDAFIPGSYPVYGPDGKLYCQMQYDCETVADCEEDEVCTDGICDLGVCG